MFNQQGKYVPELSPNAVNDVIQALKKTCHRDLGRGWRAGEIFRMLDERTKTECVKVTGLVRWLEENLEDQDLDTVVVKYPIQENGPDDGMVSVFFSLKDEPEEVVLPPAPPIPRSTNLGKARALRPMYAGQ